MSTRDAVIELIRRMPESSSISEIMAELSVRQKIDDGLQELESGAGIPHEEVKRELSRWRGQARSASPPKGGTEALPLILNCQHRDGVGAGGVGEGGGEARG